MSDISSYITVIEEASRGEEVRDAIVNALNALNTGGVVVVFDEVPTENSTNAVRSGGVFAALQNVSVVMDDVPTEGSNNAVKSGGVYSALSSIDPSITFDNTPTAGSTNAVTSGGIYSALQNIQDIINTEDITLGTTWNGSGPYTQVVTINGATSSSKVDIQVNETVIQNMIDTGTRAMWIENNNGVFTVKCIGGHPNTQLTIQCSIQNITRS